MLEIVSESQGRLASSVDRVAERTDLSKSYLRILIRNGELRAIRKGRRVLILEKDIQEYLQKDDEREMK